jgi:hypothetical protein
LVPTFTVRFAGAKAKFWIVTVAVLAVVELAEEADVDAVVLEPIFMVSELVVPYSSVVVEVSVL